MLALDVLVVKPQNTNLWLNGHQSNLSVLLFSWAHESLGIRPWLHEVLTNCKHEVVADIVSTFERILCKWFCVFETIDNELLERLLNTRTLETRTKRCYGNSCVPLNCKQNHESFDGVAVFYVRKLKELFFSL